MPLTPLQKQTSVCISAAVLKFPAVVSDIISQYQVDYNEAESPLRFSRSNKLLNPTLREYIKDALISSECDPNIKRGIFQMAQEWDYKEALNKILIEIRDQGHRINLDGTDLSGLNLSNYDLRGMTAVGTNFSRSTLDHSKMDRADLTGAVLNSASMDYVNFSHSIMYKSCIKESSLRFAQMINVDACGMVIIDVSTDQTLVTGMVTDDADMQAVLDICTKYRSRTGLRVAILSQKLFDQTHYQQKRLKNQASYKLRV